jgi:transcriptional regulator with XRE-family HTH domain
MIVSNPRSAQWLFSNLRAYREQAKLTQQALVRTTKKHDPDGYGVSKETVSKMERGERVSRRIALIVVDALSEALVAGHKPPLDPSIELVCLSSDSGQSD